jgi:hypothetical protein
MVLSFKALAVLFTDWQDSCLVVFKLTLYFLQGS